ncbi:MAG: glycosyltransferase [Campylobacter sp.]|nr:glycosyltransferase [Campylobacter sp.]
MKRLSLFIYSMGGGGAERVVSNLLPKLCESYEVHLVMMNDTVDYEIPKSVQTHYIENSAPFENGIKKLLKLPFLANRYKKLSQNLGIEIHFVWMVRPCFISAIARSIGLKGLFIFNECSTPSVLYKESNFKSKVSKFLLKKLYPKADYILPNSLESLEDLALNFGISRQKMSVLYNATDLNFINKKADESLEFKKPFFLSVGRLDEGKNHELLIRAFAKLKRDDVDLIILGEGILRQNLENLISELDLKESVYLLGFNANPYKYMANCISFVFVSKFEGFSNALIEALACGAFVISSEHKSGARELLGDNEWGVLVPVNDEEATFKAMQKALDDREWTNSYRAKATKRAEFFDRYKISENLMENIENLYKLHYKH